MDSKSEQSTTAKFYCRSVDRRKVHFHWLDVSEQMLIMRLVFTIIIINISLTIIIINIITKL